MFSLNKKIQFFNMIEILLALAVIAIGMTSVLGLFPVGLNASRNAVAENCSADVADQMITYLRVMGESSATAYDRTFSDTSPYDLTCLPTLTELDIQASGDTITIDLKDSNDVDVQTLSETFLTAYKTGDVSVTSNTFRRVAPRWAIFTRDPSGTSGLRRRVYFIVQGPNCTIDGGNRNVDYSAMALVWKDTVQIRRLESDGTTWSNWPSSDIYDHSGRINIELSWPLTLPYAERKKRYYQIVISNPN